MGHVSHPNSKSLDLMIVLLRWQGLTCPTVTGAAHNASDGLEDTQNREQGCILGWNGRRERRKTVVGSLDVGRLWKLKSMMTSAVMHTMLASENWSVVGRLRS
jgi:hypothetical protein